MKRRALKRRAQDTRITCTAYAYADEHGAFGTRAHARAQIAHAYADEHLFFYVGRLFQAFCEALLVEWPAPVRQHQLQVTNRHLQTRYRMLVRRSTPVSDSGGCGNTSKTALCHNPTLTRAHNMLNFPFTHTVCRCAYWPSVSC